MSKEQLIAEIMLACKANNVPNDGDIFLALTFRTESELRQIARELHIRVDQWPRGTNKETGSLSTQEQSGQ